MGTESAKTPESKYDCHRVTIFCKCSCCFGSKDAAFLAELKKDSESNDGMVLLKSDGVTSETNHGMSFGLVWGFE